ncbi:MAG: nuclear transport factor 2 family protein [Candidatus Aminicenantes bacterium]|nr:nuclear transport factor 2 family protein [Candidatus Aminicenantes bacterium]MDH5744638.1 nuclear transport factor 2 family protein [Candidatus Aminicenantes bacterium]
MKKLIMVIPLVILLCFTFGCQQAEEVAEEPEPVVDIEAEKAAVKAWIDDFVKCWETEDMELFSKIVAHDDDMVVFGTDAAEHFIGWEPMKESMQKQFDSSENIQVTTRELSIKVHKSGEVAWISFLMDLKGEAMGEPFNIEGMRFTGVMEKRNGNWVIVQVHASVPVAGQAVKY